MEDPAQQDTEAPTGSADPPRSPPKRCSGIINLPKFPKFGKDDIIGNTQIVKQLLSEFLGTAFLVFFGIGSVVTARGTTLDPTQLWTGYETCAAAKHAGVPDLIEASCTNPNNRTYATLNPVSPVTALHISFGFGIAVASIAQATGHISGCHLNPAVSVGLMAAGECSVMKTIIYSVTQIVGGVFGAGILRIMSWSIVLKGHNDFSPKAVLDFSGVPFLISNSYVTAVNTLTEGNTTTFPVFDPDKHLVGWSLGASTLAPEVGYVQGIFIECILTMILVFVVCGVCDNLRNDVKGSAPLAIGLAVFLCHVVGINFTGSSVNPARSIGPLPFVSVQAAPTMWKEIAVYIIGPLIGGILAGLLYNVFFRVRNEQITQPPPESCRSSQTCLT